MGYRHNNRYGSIASWLAALVLSLQLCLYGAAAAAAAAAASTTTTTTPSSETLMFEEWLALHKPKPQNSENGSRSRDCDSDCDSHDDDDPCYSYATHDEFLVRKRIYTSNLERWTRLNQIPGGARYGPETEPYADLTPDEFAVLMGSCSSSNGDGGGTSRDFMNGEKERGGSQSDGTNGMSETGRSRSRRRIQHLSRTGIEKQQDQDQQETLRSVPRLRIPAVARIASANTHAHAKLSTPFTIMDIDWRKHAPVPVPFPTTIAASTNHNTEPRETISYVTPVKNQGPHGTCWSFGAAENLEGLNVRQGFALQAISEQEFISCCEDCQGRSAEHTFAWLLNTTGGVPALEDSYPYNGNSSVPCAADTAPRASVELHSWGRVSDDDTTGNAIVAALKEHGPMGIGVDAKCFHGYQSGIVRDCGDGESSDDDNSNSNGDYDYDYDYDDRDDNLQTPRINHAVLMVAAGTDLYYSGADGHKREWDRNANANEIPPDTTALRFPTTVDFYVIKNSWGSKWGEEGYVRIERGKDWWGKINVIYTE